MHGREEQIASRLEDELEYDGNTLRTAFTDIFGFDEFILLEEGLSKRGATLVAAEEHGFFLVLFEEDPSGDRTVESVTFDADKAINAKRTEITEQVMNLTHEPPQNVDHHQELADTAGD